MDVKEGDIIELILEDKYNGIYRVADIGSAMSPWVLELC